MRVVEAGTFTKAADSLALPKPTVTRLMQTLEAHLQTKLLNRTTRRVTVTADGAAYYDRAVRLLGELDELESSMSQRQGQPARPAAHRRRRKRRRSCCSSRRCPISTPAIPTSRSTSA